MCCRYRTCQTYHLRLSRSLRFRRSCRSQPYRLPLTCRRPLPLQSHQPCLFRFRLCLRRSWQFHPLFRSYPFLSYLFLYRLCLTCLFQYRPSYHRYCPLFRSYPFQHFHYRSLTCRLLQVRQSCLFPQYFRLLYRLSLPRTYRIRSFPVLYCQFRPFLSRSYLPQPFQVQSLPARLLRAFQV